MHRDRESWGNSDDRDNGVANVIFWGRGDHVEDAARDEGASCYWNDCWGASHEPAADSDTAVVIIGDTCT